MPVMTKFNTVLIDDEVKSTDVLQYLIESHCPELDIVGVFNKPKEGLKFIEAHDIDLLLIDIQMPEIDGFQLLDQLTDIDFNVVFVTAFDEFALKAFRYYALDFILKPVDVDLLKNLVKRLIKREKPQYDKGDYNQIFQRLGNDDDMNHLAVPTSRGVTFIQFDEIIRLQADSNYTQIIREDSGNLYASKTLKYFENILPTSHFFRPHQSHLINVKYMDHFIRQDGGYIVMRDGTEIALARSKRREFLDRYI